MVNPFNVFIILGFLLVLSACQISAKDEALDGSIQQKNNFAEGSNIGLIETDATPSRYLLKLGFVCEPEMNESYKRRVENLLNKMIYISFFGEAEKFLVRKVMFYNSKMIAYVEITKPVFDKTERVELQVKNRSLNISKEQFNRPILLPDSVCNK